MKKTLTSFLLLMIFLSFGLHSCQKKDAIDEVVNKRGIIISKIDSLKYSEKYCCILSPADGFSVYDKPNGKKIGKLQRIGIIQEDNQVPNQIYFVTNDKKVKVENYREIGYEIFALNYKDFNNGFVKVMDSTKSFWLNVPEIDKQGFKAINWRDYMTQEKEGYYANEPGLRLRKEPNAESDIIGSVRGDLYEITLTKNISGQWCKVKVKKYKKHPCDSDLKEEENIESTSEGWLKIIDDNGEPNLWSYTRGC